MESLVTGTSYVLVDFPRIGEAPGTRAEEDASGASRAYLVDYAADDVINWSLDEHGNYEWVVIRTKQLKKDESRMRSGGRRRAGLTTTSRTSGFTAVERRADEAVELMDEGTHGLAKLGQVPLFALRIPEGLWLLNRAGSLQLEHFNKSNALGWALTMGLFAMPVVYSEREWNQMVGESYYIQLGPEDRFGWTEPEGKVYQIAADNLARLQEEIYRVCYLTQAGGSLEHGRQQSGLSKQRDFSITQEVLRAYGDAVKDQMRRVLRAIDGGREDGLDDRA